MPNVNLARNHELLAKHAVFSLKSPKMRLLRRKKRKLVKRRLRQKLRRAKVRSNRYTMKPAQFVKKEEKSSAVTHAPLSTT